MALEFYTEEWQAHSSELDHRKGLWHAVWDPPGDPL